MAEEYYTFNETVAKLGISEDELLNLVSSNQLRAFRINRETKFRIEDVEGIAQGSGGSAMSVEESGVVELDDLPDDVVLLEESDSAPELSLAEDLTEETALAHDAGESSEELMIFDESDGQQIPEAVSEESPMELSESSELMDFNDSSEALEISGADSDPALAETVVTDSSAISGTENISLDDDDIEFSTQEITVQEDAISEDEVSAQETVVNSPDADEDFTEEIEADEEAISSHRRPAAGARSSAGRRHMQALDAPKGSKDLLFTGLIGLTVVGMIYPVLMMCWLLFFGTTTGRDMISVSDQKYSGKIENISPPATPKMFQWIVEENALTKMVENTTTKDGLTGNPSKEQREKMVQKILDAKAAAPKVVPDAAPAEEVPAEDAAPAEEPAAAPAE